MDDKKREEEALLKRMAAQNPNLRHVIDQYLSSGAFGIHLRDSDADENQSS